MNEYLYEGPVLLFDKVVDDKWQAETTAQSECKARSNLTYRFKVANRLIPTAKITLPGKFKLLGKGSENG